MTKLYEVIIALRIKSLSKALILNQARKGSVRILNMDRYCICLGN